MNRLWLLLLLAPVAHAQTNPPPLDVTAAVLRGIEFFRAQALSNDEAWLCFPVPGQKIARYEKRQIHYKQVEITIPGPTPGEPMRQQQPHGGWGRRDRMQFMASTSLLALREVLPDMEPNELAARYNVPHLSTGYYAKQNFVYCRSEFEAPYFTLGALLFLSDGLPEGWKP